MTEPVRFDFKAYLKEKKEQVDTALALYLPEVAGLTSDLMKSMRYSIFAGGKRLRPVLCLAGANTVGALESNVMPAACALEMIHTYSLIHDDLPIMDDDDMRRGKPTNHKVFGEVMALLAGDGLLTEAFTLLTSPRTIESLAADRLLKTIHLISRAAGHDGMVGGQVVDMQWEGKNADLETLQFLHSRKTGALITVSVVAGATLGGGDESQIRLLSSYGKKIGLAFQISDDILDVEGDSATMGKMAGADEQKGKTTYPSLMGLEKSKETQNQLVKEAVETLETFGERAEPLRQIAYYIIERKK